MDTGQSRIIMDASLAARGFERCFFFFRAEIMSAASVVGCMLIGTLNFGARKQHANKFLDYRICDRGQATYLLKTQLRHVP